GFVTALAVFVTGTSQSRQHGKRIENEAKTGIYGFVAIKSAYYSKSRQSREKSPSMPLEIAREYESNGDLGFYWASLSLVDKIICDLIKPPDTPHLHTSSSNQRHCFHYKDVLGDAKEGEEEKQITEEQVAKARYWKIPIFYDNDEDYTIAITLKEPDNSLRMGDEHLDTILATKSDEFIKSSVENLVPNPSESKGEHESDVPACDDFTTFSNLLFDVDDDFSSKIISMKIDPHHFNAESDLIESLLNHNSSIISSSLKIDSLLDEFTGELILLKSIPPGIDKADCDPEEEVRLDEKLLYDNLSPRPPEEFNSENSDAAIESFSPSPIPVEDSDPFMEEIDLFLAYDGSVPSSIDNDYSNSEGDNFFPERLLHDDPIPLPDILDFSNVV
nr:hypothetical protein [Tanacetum cinerariifolium]